MNDESRPDDAEGSTEREPTDGHPEGRPYSERPAARPIKPSGNAAEPAPHDAAQMASKTSDKQGWLFGLGCLPWFGIIIGSALLILLIASFTGGLTRSSTTPQACLDAQNARSLAESDDLSRSDRDVAAMEYAVKAEQCERQGGDVP